MRLNLRSSPQSNVAILSWLLFAMTVLPTAVLAQSIDSAALEQASEKIQQAVQSGDVAGASHFVWHRGEEVHFETAGVRDVDDQLPFERGTIVRIYSMTKPITSVAAMKLYEQGKFTLDDAVAKFIPAFENVKVWNEGDDGSKTVSPTRPITIRDVFRHTTGYGYGGGPNKALDVIYHREGMFYHPPHAMMPPKMDIAAAAESLSRIPTHHQPGARFTYGFNTDLLGRLIEVWSGKPLDACLRAEIFEPLGMDDTGFSVPQDKRSRFASVHTRNGEGLAIADKFTTSPFNDGFSFLSGGGGLVSTIDDYAKFCQSLVGGEVRILAPETLDMMFTDQLGDAGGDFRFGLGFAIKDVTLGQGDSKRKAKEVSWGGYASTNFRIVPDEELIQIFFRQRVPMQSKLAEEIFPIVYQGVSVGEGDSDESREPYWPGWLGPSRDGWVAGFEPPTSWPGGLEKRWQVEVGTGYATPVVVDDVVYLHARQGEEEVVWCLDRKSGETRWRKSYGVPFTMGGGGESHGKGPKSNAVYADGRLFTFSITGILSAWDAETGSLLWRNDKAQEFEKTTPYWGASTSPIVAGDSVFVHFGNDQRGVLVAHDVKTGEELWSQGRDGASYSSPLISELGGVRQVIEWNHRALVGVDVETGEKLWEQPFEHVGTNQNMPTPSIDNGCILVGGENRGLYSFRPSRDGDQWSVQERWFQDKVALDMSSAVVNDGKLFGFSHYGRGRLFCVDTESGQVLWQGPGRSGQNATFLAIPGHVVALMNTGELKVIKASGEEMREVASYQVADSETWAAPVLSQRGVLVKDKTTLAFWEFADE